MAKKNDFLQRQQDKNQAYFDAGEEIGIQKMCDYLCIVLRDPVVMGRDVFGRKRMEKIFAALSKAADDYEKAFTDDKEADYLQERLDAYQKELWCEKFQPFYDRYPILKRIKYDKARKGWK